MQKSPATVQEALSGGGVESEAATPRIIPGPARRRKICEGEIRFFKKFMQYLRSNLHL